MQCDKWHCYIRTEYYNATFAKCAIIRKTARYLNRKCLLHYTECKQIYRPEHMLTISISASVAYLCAAALLSISLLSVFCIDTRAPKCFKIRLRRSQRYITDAIKWMESKYTLSSKSWLFYCIHRIWCYYVQLYDYTSFTTL